MNYLSKVFWKIVALGIYKYQFRKFGKKSRIDFPLRIDGKKNIEIGSNVLVQYKTWLGCFSVTGNKKPILRIGDNSTIGNFNHIISTKSIILEENVLTADKVYISDNLHNYKDPTISIIEQPIKQVSPVVIGEGSWLGENVCVIGASVGKHCVVGANAVVIKDIPDYSVAVGIPAKVIKKFNFNTNRWEKVS